MPSSCRRPGSADTFCVRLAVVQPPPPRCWCVCLYIFFFTDARGALLHFTQFSHSWCLATNAGQDLAAVALRREYGDAHEAAALRVGSCVRGWLARRELGVRGDVRREGPGLEDACVSLQVQREILKSTPHSGFV